MLSWRKVAGEGSESVTVSVSASGECDVLVQLVSGDYYEFINQKRIFFN